MNAIPSMALVHSADLSELKGDPCPFGYGTGCGGGGEIDSATKAKVANILEGILKNLSNKKALVQGMQHVSKADRVEQQSHAGGLGTIGVSASVKQALQGLVARLQKNTQQTNVAKALSMLLAGDNEPIDPRDKGKGGEHPGGHP